MPSKAAGRAWHISCSNSTNKPVGAGDGEDNMQLERLFKVLVTSGAAIAALGTGCTNNRGDTEEGQSGGAAGLPNSTSASAGAAAKRGSAGDGAGGNAPTALGGAGGEEQDLSHDQDAAAGGSTSEASGGAGGVNSWLVW
jgi:hypothetical protein